MGPSMCVPVWAVMERCETLQGAPLMPICAMRWILTAGSPCQWTMPSTTGSDTSIHSAAILESDYVFDGGAVFVAEKKFAVGIDGVATGDERFDCLGPAFDEDAEIANRVLEGGAVGVDGADDRLIFQDDVAHDVVAGDRNGFAGRGNAGENEDSILTKDTQDIEGNLGDTDAFIYQIDVAHARGELFGSFNLGGDVL